MGLRNTVEDQSESNTNAKGQQHQLPELEGGEEAGGGGEKLGVSINIAASTMGGLGNSLLFGSIGAASLFRPGGENEMISPANQIEFLDEDFAQHPVTSRFQNQETESAFVAFATTDRSVQLVSAAFAVLALVYSGYDSHYGATNPITGGVYYLCSIFCLLIVIGTLFVTYPAKHEALKNNTFKLIHAARLEKLHAVTWLVWGLAVCLTESGWSGVDCESYALDANKYDVAYCRQSLFGFAALQMSLAIYFYQIRSLIVIPGLIFLFVSTGLGYVMAITTMTKYEAFPMALEKHRELLAPRFTVLGFHVCVLIGCVWTHEIQNRRRFIRWASMRRTEGILTLHRTAVAGIVTSLLPGDTVSKLVAQQPVLDVRENCAVAVVQLADYFKWTTTMVPKSVVLALDRVGCALDALTAHPIEKVGIYGDIFVFSLGLRAPLPSQKASLDPMEAAPIHGDGSCAAGTPFTDLLLLSFSMLTELTATAWTDDEIDKRSNSVGDGGKNEYSGNGGVIPLALPPINGGAQIHRMRLQRAQARGGAADVVIAPIATREPTTLLAKIGVACGPCTGGLVGSNLKYNLSGPAFSRAKEAGRHAPPGSIVATEALLSYCEESVFSRQSTYCDCDDQLPLSAVELGDKSVAVQVLPKKLKEQPPLHHASYLSSSAIGSFSEDRGAGLALSTSIGDQPRNEPLSMADLRQMLEPRKDATGTATAVSTDSSSNSNSQSPSSKQRGDTSSISTRSNADSNGGDSQNSDNRGQCMVASAGRSVNRDVLLTKGFFGFGRRFVKPEQEQAYLDFTLAQDRSVSNRVLGLTAGLLFSTILLAVPAYQERANYAGVACAILNFMMVGIRWTTTANVVVPATLSPLLLVLQIILYQVTVAVNPTNLLNGQVMMLLLICLHTIYVSVPRGPSSTIVGALTIVGAAVGAVVLFVLRFGTPFTATLDTVFYTFIYTIVVTYGMKCRDEERRDNFVDYVKTQITTMWVEQEKNIMNMLLEKLVPKYAIPIVRRRCVVEGEATRVMKPLSDLICMEVTLHQPSAMRSPWHATRMKDASLEGGGRSGGVGLINQVALVEEMISEFGGGLLNTVNILGDSIQIAGPLQDAGKSDNQLRNSVASSVVEMAIANLVRQQRSQDKRMFECLVSVMRFVDAFMSKLRESCTLVLSAGSGFGAVIGSHPPQFSVLGVAPRLAAAISSSVPVQGHVFASSSFQKFVGCYSGVTEIMEELNLAFEKETTWRIRGIGSQQVWVLSRCQATQEGLCIQHDREVLLGAPTEAVYCY